MATGLVPRPKAGASPPSLLPPTSHQPRPRAPLQPTCLQRAAWGPGLGKSGHWSWKARWGLYLAPTAHRPRTPELPGCSSPSLEGGSAGSQSCLACGFLNIGPGWGGGSARLPPHPHPLQVQLDAADWMGSMPAGDCCLRKLGGQDDLGNLSCLPSLGGDRLLNVTWRWGWGIPACHSVTPGGDATCLIVRGKATLPCLRGGTVP